MVPQTKSKVIFLLICCIVTISCNKDSKNMPLVFVDVHVIPTVRTEDAVSLISDSGITRYRMAAKIWEMYSNEKDPYWFFPEKIHVERFDSLFRVDVNIVADTAYYFEKKELWQAIGNVVVKNMEGRIFETSELFWDRTVPPNVVNAFYTDRPVKITEPDGTISHGRNGFKADRSLNIIRLFLMTGEIYVEESTDSLQQNTIYSDSI
jgi:hypothetical protein